MAVESVTVHVPRALYARLEERARQTQRSVEEELVEALAEAVSLDDDSLPADVVAALQPLDTMSDEALWQLVRTRHLSSSSRSTSGGTESQTPAGGPHCGRAPDG